ncbi:YuzF family protein [Bacillus shivajii]|uniref:YuzF family protein n=1 Tax=Bacillus shivajii TaxID=1983719 RepID=UPI001CFB56E2|nr:YuzF family protein [Bacillus shivajii]UCZ52398.1 YuzF family protein [Bacillus shivajii]
MYDQEQYEQEERNGEVEYVAMYDPFVVHTLQSVMGNNVVVQTTEGSVRGKVADVKPDHVVIQKADASFFIRVQEIVWIMPN